MTIALGLIAQDGVVIAADRQETEGDQKKDQRKIDTLWAGGIGSLVIAGAGNGPYIDSMTTRLQYAFGSKVWQWSDHEEMTEKFRASHAAFYSENVLPFAEYQPYERPDYELLFGCSIVAKHHFLWYSHKLTLNRVQGFRAVGVGASTAESLLKKFYVQRLPLKVAISLAAYVVYQVKNSVEGCGFATDILFTQPHTPPCRVSEHTLKEMEDGFAKFRFIERDDLYKMIGGGVVPQNRNAKDWNKFRREIRVTFNDFCQEFDEQYAYDSRPSASQKSEPEQ
ncbi:MAG: hypothetical protein WAN65_15790 [Candidatus Sulfotelmatobacter sp.]